MTSSILAATDAPLLDVRDLHVDFINGRAVTNAVRGVSFQLGREKLAIVGESGSGKSTVGRALLRLHPAKAQISATRMQFGDVDLRTVSEAQMRGIRGKRISMIMQDPKYSLNPVVCVSVGLQVLGLLDDLVQSRGLGLIFISHDINLVRSFCDRVLVMYAGRVVESIAACDLHNAKHPYTQGLINALPEMNHRRPVLPVLQRQASWLTE